MSIGRMAFMAVLVIWVLSCGGRSRPLSPPAITAQPQAQTVAVGDPWSFTVAATGTEPLTYQWTWNGSPMLYGTGPTFSVAPAVAADNGSTFQVTVTNSAGSVTSTAASLAVASAPRAPLKGDLRFKDVDAFPFTLQGIARTGFNAQMQLGLHNGLGTPLEIGGPVLTVPDGFSDWYWSVMFFGLPEGVPQRDFTVKGGQLANLPTDLEPLLAPNTVITSVDIPGAEGVYALAWVTTAWPGNYTCVRNAVAPSALPALAAQEGAAGRVITAMSFNAGQVYVFSYGWDGDPSTVYETQVATPAAGEVEAQAAALSAGGYIITALGGNDGAGYLLVGTRVQGDSLPRPFKVATSTGLGRGYAMVGWYLDTSRGSDPASWTGALIGQQ